MCRQWRRDHPPHHPSPICWSGCRMRSVTIGSSILSRHSLTWVMVSAQCPEGQILNSPVHIREEENSAADAPARWSGTFRVCAQKMEEPGVAKCRRQDHRWCHRMSDLYLCWICRSACQPKFVLIILFSDVLCHVSFFMESKWSPRKRKWKKMEMEWEVNNNTEKDWLFFLRSCWRWLSGLWTIEFTTTTSSRSHFRLDWKRCKLFRTVLHWGSRSERRTDLLLQARTNQSLWRTLGLTYFISLFPHNEDEPVGNHWKLSQHRPSLKPLKESDFCRWMWCILTWPLQGVGGSGRAAAVWGENWCL